jgi:hypothetical protein
MIQDWPQDIGETKFSYIRKYASFVPIMFEMTVFLAHLMVITFYMRSKLWLSNKLKILM